MIPLIENLHRGRYLMFLIGLFILFFVAASMVVGSLILTETALRWSRYAVIVLSWILATLIAQIVARRGKPGWLFKSPPGV